jgi:hypothetical protein
MKYLNSIREQDDFCLSCKDGITEQCKAKKVADKLEKGNNGSSSKKTRRINIADFIIKHTEPVTIADFIIKSKPKCLNCGSTEHFVWMCKAGCGHCGRKGHTNTQCMRNLDNIDKQMFWSVPKQLAKNESVVAMMKTLSESASKKGLEIGNVVDIKHLPPPPNSNNELKRISIIVNLASAQEVDACLKVKNCLKKYVQTDDNQQQLYVFIDKRRTKEELKCKKESRKLNVKKRHTLSK